MSNSDLNGTISLNNVDIVVYRTYKLEIYFLALQKYLSALNLERDRQSL